MEVFLLLHIHKEAFWDKSDLSESEVTERVHVHAHTHTYTHTHTVLEHLFLIALIRHLLSK